MGVKKRRDDDGNPPADPLDVALGVRARELRKEAGLTQVEQSRRVAALGQPMDSGRLSLLENGLKPWTTSEIRTAAASFMPNDPLAPAKLQMDAETASLVEAFQKEGELGVSSWLTRFLSRRRKSP